MILKIKQWLKNKKRLNEKIKPLNGAIGTLFYLDFKYDSNKNCSGQANLNFRKKFKS